MDKFLEQKDWDPLLELLRHELQEYGGLHNLLERQQKEIFERVPEAVLITNEEIEAYTGAMGELRKEREAMVDQIGQSCGCEPNLALRKMLPHFPSFIHPLLEALMDEINQMVTRTRRKARQNFLLLSRTMEITQETLRAMQPDNYSKTYSKKGRVGVNQRMPSRYKAFV